MNFDFSLNLESMLNFGKYKGNLLKFVMNNDVTYITWCLESSYIKLNAQAMHYYCDKLKEFKDDEQRKTREASEQFERQQREREERRQKEEDEREERQRKNDDNASSYDWSTFNDFFKGARRRRQGSQYNSDYRADYQNVHQSSNCQSVRVSSPAAQWDHLPAKQKHGSVLRLNEVMTNGKVSKEAIKQQYKKLMLEYHPDKVECFGPLIKEIAKEMSVRINVAYTYYKEIYNL
jgi:hypothetical protein